MLILSKTISALPLDFRDYFKFGIFFVGRTPTFSTNLSRFCICSRQ